MPVSIISRCKDMRLCIRNITKAVTCLAHGPISRPSLLGHLPIFSKLRITLISVTKLTDSSQMFSQDLKEEHACFIGDFAALLTVMVSQMERMGMALSQASYRCGAEKCMLLCLWDLHVLLLLPTVAPTVSRQRQAQYTCPSHSVCPALKMVAASHAQPWNLGCTGSGDVTERNLTHHDHWDTSDMPHKHVCTPCYSACWGPVCTPG